MSGAVDFEVRRDELRSTRFTETPRAQLARERPGASARGRGRRGDVQRVYLGTLEGRTAPDEGHVLSLQESQ